MDDLGLIDVNENGKENGNRIGSESGNGNVTKINVNEYIEIVPQPIA